MASLSLEWAPFTAIDKDLSRVEIGSACGDKAPLDCRSQEEPWRKFVKLPTAPYRRDFVVLSKQLRSFHFSLFLLRPHTTSARPPVCTSPDKEFSSLFRSRARQSKFSLIFSLHLRDFSFARCWRLLTVVIRRRRKKKETVDSRITQFSQKFSSQSAARKSRSATSGAFAGPQNRNRFVESLKSLHATATAGTMCDQCMVKFLSVAVASVHKHADYFLSNQL